MKLLVSSDWQATPVNLPKCWMAVDDLIRYAHEHKVSTIVHCGDVKNALNPVDQRVTNFMVDVTKRFQEEELGFIVLMGNHDRIGMSFETGSCAPVLASAGAHVVTTPTELHLLGSPYRFFMLPYQDSLQAAREQLKDWAQRSAERKDSVLFFHQELSTAKMSRHMISRDTSALKVDELFPDKYRFCIGGHLHFPQKLEENVYYVGSPFCTDFGEANQRKRYLLVDLDDQLAGCKIKSLPSSVPGLYDETYPAFDQFGPDDFKGATIRVHVPYESSSHLLSVKEKARADAQLRYPDSLIVVFPERIATDGQIKPVTEAASDIDLIFDFVKEHKPDLVEETADQVAAYLIAQLEQAGVLRRSTEGLRLNSARGKNFLSYRDIAITYEPGITVVTGTNLDWPDRQNGVGKTNALQLPAVVLFGKTLKGQQFDGWRYNKAPKNESSWGELDFDLPDNRHVVLRRQRNPHKLNLIVDGKDMSSGLGNKDSQKTLEALTGITWDVMTNALYIDQQHISTLLTGTDKDRKSIFSQFQNLERFAVALERVKADRRKTEDALDRLSVDAEMVAQKIQTVKQFLGSLKTYDIADLEEKLDLARKAKDKAKKELDAEKERIDNERQAIRNELSKKDSYLSDLITEAALAEGKQSPLNANILRAKSMDGICPTCKQKVDKDILHKCAEEWQAEWDRLEALASKHKSEAKRVKEEMAVLRVKEQKLGATLEPLEQAFSSALLRFRMADQALTAGKEQEAEHAEYAETLRKARQGKKSIEFAMRGLHSEIEFYNFCIHVFSRDGLPAYLAAQLVPRLNAAAEFYSELFSEGEIAVEFLIDGEDIDVCIINVHGGATVEDQSQGESRMASLIVSFALREVMVPMNVLFLDEPGEGLDSHNATVFANALTQIADKFGSIWVTTHNPHILSALSGERNLEVVKENGVSRLEV
jgi:DNA repair exonuclease SbcCD nuclease subunit/predicted ATPase